MRKILKYSYLGIFLRSIINSFYAAKEYTKDRDLGFIFFYNFFITRSFYGLTYFRNKINKKKKVLNKELKNNYSENGETTTNVIEELSLKGYSGEYKLKDNLIEKIKNQFIENIDQSIITYNDGGVSKFDKTQLNVTSDNYEKLLSKKNIYIIKSSVQIKPNTFLNEWIQSEYFVSLAQSYLNTKKLSANCTIFFSNNLNDKSSKSQLLSKAAQKYHFDIDYKKFFKILIYFTDVDEVQNGAHVYIPTTHRKKARQHQITQRFDDNDIENIYPKKKVFIGKKGTFFFVDTFGFHKGSPITIKPRIAAFIEYGYGHFELTKNTIFI